LARLTDLAVEAAGDRSVRLAVQHLHAADRAEEMAQRLRSALHADVVFGEVPAVMGVHVGPGAVAVTVAPADSP
jgi:fatty acid-binding protein DegV